MGSKEPERTRVLESHGEAIAFLKRVLREGDCVLIKGSRRMAMEKIAEALLQFYQRRDRRS